jgi:nucleotide-binding universal stress UspA family protein
MMHKIKKIMIAVDFSEYTEPSVQYGISLAKDVKANLLLVNVVNSRDLSSFERYLALKI